MPSLSASFASLVKSANGDFKSEKQASFLLSQCLDNEYTSIGSIYNSPYVIIYSCDSKGVYQVTKYLPKTNKSKVTWSRLNASDYALKQSKDSLQLARTNKRNKYRAIANSNSKKVEVLKAHTSKILMENINVDFSIILPTIKRLGEVMKRGEAISERFHKLANNLDNKATL